MEQFHRRLTAVAAVPYAEPTSSALLTGATVIPLEDSGSFTDAGGSVRILGEIYTFSDMDEGDESGVPSITLDSGLLDDVPAETLVEMWNATKGEVPTEWVATVTDEDDGSSNEALLSHTLIALIASGIPIVGESVTVTVDDGGTWWVTEVHGASPGYDPVFIRTGGLGADTVVWAGTENGRRAQLDGVDGALECFDSTNTQTVNLDGDENYITGTLATADDGSRVEVGPGTLFTLPANEVRFYSGHADEIEPAKISTAPQEVDPGEFIGRTEIAGQEWDGDSTPPSLRLDTGGGTSNSQITVTAHGIELDVDASSSVLVSGGTLNATMGAGSVGTSTFRDSVDARVTAIAPGAVPAASETVAGKAELATQAETNTGTDDTRIVTPLKLATHLSSLAYTERAADGTQTITTGAAAAVVTWPTSTVAERGSLTYSAGVFTVGVAGIYLVTTNLLFASNATGRRQASVRKNGATVTNANIAAPSAGQASASSTFVFTCAASDTIDVTAFQDSGSNLAIVSASKITIKNLGV